MEFLWHHGEVEAGAYKTGIYEWGENPSQCTPHGATLPLGMQHEVSLGEQRGPLFGKGQTAHVQPQFGS